MSVLKAVAYRVQAENLTFMASSLAYHAFVSLLPLLLMLLALVSTVGDSTLEQGLFELTQAILTPSASEMLVTELRRASASTSISILSVAFLVWGTLRIFWGLDTAFSVIYDSEVENTIPNRIVDGLLVLATVTIAVLAALTVEAEIAPFAGGVLGWASERLALFVGLALTFFPMYYLFPDQEDMRLPEVLPGVLIATFGLTVLESLFSFYVTFSSQSPERNVVIAFLLLLTWLYLSSLVVLVGAVVNVVVSNRSPKVNVNPILGGAFEKVEPTNVRAELVTALERLDERIRNDENVVVRTDDGEVSLPSPNVIVVNSGDDGTVFHSGPVGLELYWFPREGDGEDGT